MQIPIISGVYTDSDVDYRIAYPINMRPIVKGTGISSVYLRPADGIRKIGTGPGVSRGAINWEGVHYRVLGSKLCSIAENGNIAVLGDVGNDNKPVSFAYSFDRLAVASSENLYYLRNNTLSLVADPNIGRVLDVTWVDGYFMTTDGAFLVVTELSDPTTVNPLKYGSSEIDPDPILGLVKLRNEVYAVNRYTIEVFGNTGGSLFPFSRRTGAQIPRGALGTHCAILYNESIAFLGSGVGESPGVFIASGGTSQKISSREVDDILEQYTEEELSGAVLESINDRGQPLLWIRLPDRTLVFDIRSSEAMEKPAWFILSSSSSQDVSKYRAIDAVWCYDKWQVGDAASSDIGVLDGSIATHFGDTIYWEFSTFIVYNKSNGAIFHSLELVALPGRAAFEEDAYVNTSYSLDGRNWSQRRPLFIGKRGNRGKRLIWRRQGNMKNFRVQKFDGDSKAFLSVAGLEANIEGLSS